MSIKNLTLKKALPWIMVVAGIVGIYCAFVLSQDKLKLIENPDLQLDCSLNPIVACGNVIKSAQGHAFGFPNPFLGLAGYAAVLTIGVAILAGGKFKRWFWLAIQVGLLLAMFFLGWLLFQSLYSIHALCPYCLVVDAVTIPLFWYVTLYNIDQKNIRLPKGRAQKAYAWVRRHHLDLLVLFFILIFVWILHHFWYYYGRNF
jgi:uncharacterized membrane protein